MSRTTNKINKIAIICLVTVSVIVIVIAIISRQRLKSNSTSSSAHVLQVFTARGINGYSVRYVYQINGKEYFNSSLLAFNKINGTYLGCLLNNRNLPVVYERSNPQNSRMLFDSKDFGEFNIEVEDSLKRIVSYIDYIAVNYTIDSLKNPCQ